MPDAMVQDQNLLEELAALRRHLHRFDSQFPRKTIPPAPPWNPGFFFKLRHDPERMNREHIAADHYNCHRDGVFRELQKAAEEYHSRDFDPNKFKMGSSTAKEWILAVKAKTLCRLYLDFTHAQMREYAIYGCPQLDNDCERVESIRKPLHYLGWYAQILEYEAMAKVRTPISLG